MNRFTWAAMAAVVVLSACSSNPPRHAAPVGTKQLAEPAVQAVEPAPAAQAPLAVLSAPAASTQVIESPVAPVLPAPQADRQRPVAPKSNPKPASSAAATPKPSVVKPKAVAKTTKPASVALPVPAVPIATRVIRGRMELAAGARQKVAAGEVADGLVYFLPQSGGAKPKPGRYSISTHSKGFSPNLLVVPAGSTVAFPNKDSILHNVYSRTPGSSFDLKTYGPGETRQTVLAKPGLVIVNCNVHHNMRANIVVLSTPYYVRPRKDGSFQLDNLPPGPGTLVFWHPRSNAQTQPINAGATPVLGKLVASKPRLDAHLLMGH